MTAGHNPNGPTTNEIRQQAQQCVPKTSTDVSGMSAEEIESLLNQLEVHQEERTLQNEELRRLQLELGSSQEHLADLYDFAPVGYVTVDANGLIINANLTTATMLGRERSKIVGTRLAQYCDDGSRLELRDHIKKVLTSQMSQSCELKFTMPEGATLDIRLHSNHLAASGTGRDRQCRVIMTDITGDKTAESKLRDSERFFRTIFDQAAVGVAQLNSVSGVILHVNERYCEILGSPAENLLGKTWMELTHPDDLPADLDNMERLRGGDIREFSIEKRMNRHDGSLVWINLTVSPSWQPGESPSTHIAIVEDITERKQAEAERARLLDILQRSLNEIYVFDAETLRFEYVNAGALRNLGHSLDAMYRMTPVDIKPEYTETKFRDLIAPLQSGKQERLRFETLHQRADGSCYPVEVHLQLIPRENDEVLLGVVLDITERKQNEEAIRRSEDNLRELNALLEQRVAERTAELTDTNAELTAFARTISHDLRAPLRAMEGFAMVLADDYGARLDEKGHEFIQHIVDSAQRMDQLVSELLAYSRLGRSRLSISSISLNSVVNEALAQLRTDLKACDSKVDVAEPMATVLGDRSTLRQVVTNLLSNAIKFVAPNVRPKVRLWTEAKGDGRIRLWVEDNGIGIDPEYQDRIFRVFERLHGIESYPGTGIGLAVVARACERLGGRCGFESQLGQGSRFWVELPEGER